jgi:hypothetical protein|tara:strand:+ start:2141 stop:2530 length:390 start_codon:yes stop_codon:yes gene_type:complete
MARLTQKEIFEIKQEMSKGRPYTWDEAEAFEKAVGFLPSQCGTIKLEVGNLISFTGGHKERWGNEDEYNYETTLLVLSKITRKSWKVLDQAAGQVKVLIHRERHSMGCWMLEGAGETYRQTYEVKLLSR